jgi:phosphatidylglycerol:prolipoprotein diacylglycerol transferase
MSVYLIAYGIFRFLIEFVRDDERGQLLGFISPSQFWSILMIGLGIGLYFLVDKLTAPAEVSAEEQ